MAYVLQEWTQRCTLMQQTVLITCTRGPDGLHKDHIAKLLLRWVRRCFLVSAMDGSVLLTPCVPGGGSFMGPSIPVKEVWVNDMWAVLVSYMKSLDEVPHHFQLHLLHAIEILGYKHPDVTIREFWYHSYCTLVNDMHLNPETEQQMDFRLGDSEIQWRSCENAPASQPGEN